MSTATATLSPSSIPNDPARNPFEVARSHLIRRLLEMSVPPAHAIGDVADHIREAANIFDEWLYAVGSQVAERVSSTDFDMRNFQGAFLGAVDGNATYEIEGAMTSSRYRTLRRGAY